MAKPYNCKLAAGPDRTGVASVLKSMLAESADLSVTLTTFPCHPVAGELYLPVTGEDNYEAVRAQLATLQDDQPGVCSLPLSINLSEAQVSGLLAAGAADFLSAPPDACAVAVRVRRACSTLHVAHAPQVRAMMSPRLKDMVGSSPTFCKALSMLPTLAGYDAGVLILGETGTGKEIYARAIHYSSSRAAGPWVAINCGAVPVDLLESELFGHVRGAFTHAHALRTGLVREAEGGTLFLDEIDSLPLQAQSKLLRFVQEMEYRPVGGDKLMHANVRIVAASNQDLASLAERGGFRRDLYFRLSVLIVTLPPLRERREDIGDLARYFIDYFCLRNGKLPLRLSPQTLRCMQAYAWPGNVRELRHSIERAVLMSQHPTLQPEDLQIPMTDAVVPTAGPEPLCAAKARMVAAFERDYIRRQLVLCNGNITHAALAAGKNRRAFFELMRKYHISAVCH